MKQYPLVIVNNHVEKVNMTLPTSSLISHEALDKLAFAMLRTMNKFHRLMRKNGIDKNWVTSYIEELTPDKCIFVVCYGFGIVKPTQDYARYEVNTNDLLNDLTPERIIPDGED